MQDAKWLNTIIAKYPSLNVELIQKAYSFAQEFRLPSIPTDSRLSFRTEPLGDEPESRMMDSGSSPGGSVRNDNIRRQVGALEMAKDSGSSARNDGGSEAFRNDEIQLGINMAEILLDLSS